MAATSQKRRAVTVGSRINYTATLVAGTVDIEIPFSTIITCECSVSDGTVAEYLNWVLDGKTLTITSSSGASTKDIRVSILGY